MDKIRTLTAQDGARIAYRLWQPGKPRRLIVLLHGMASNLTRWSEFVEHTTLKDSWDLLWPDLRGHGKSSYHGAITMDKWCHDLATLLKMEGYRQALIIGHSLGAQIAPQFVNRYPDAASGLVLLDPVFDQALRGDMRTLSRYKIFLYLLLGLVRLLNLFGLRRRAIPNRDLRKLDEKTRAELLDQGKQEAMIEHYSSVWADLKYFPTAHYLSETLEMIRPLPDPSRVNVPVLVLLSKGVTYTDIEETIKIIARYPDAEEVTIDAYHWPLTEKPDEVRRAIEEWCARRFGRV